MARPVLLNRDLGGLQKQSAIFYYLSPVGVKYHENFLIAFNCNRILALKSIKEKDQTSSSPLEVATTAGDKQDHTLKQLKFLARRSTLWVLLGFGLGQILRLGGNIILARLLFPEAFGMMAVVSALLMGINMFSDLGISASVIQNKRGEEPNFLRTAWVIQIIRSTGVTLIAMALAWPMALLSGEPTLFWMIVAVSFTALFSGFNSTWLLVYSRRLILKKVILLNLVGQFLSLFVTVILAWYWHSVWALVVGSFIGPLTTLVVSHTVLGGVTMRFLWEKEIVHELVRFGRWIFISTALGFLATKADIFILSGFATMSFVGFFSIAKNLSRLTMEALTKLSSMVLFPIYSRLADRKDNSLHQEMFKMRLALLALSLPPLWVFILWGDNLIALLYDERYHDAGWMLQILAAGATANVVTLTMYPILLAMGDSFRHMLKTVVRLFFQIVGMIIGGYFWGIPGFIVGLALTDWLSYPFGAYLVNRYGGWLPMLDTIALGSSLIVMVIAFS